MNPKIKAVSAMSGYRLNVDFCNGERREFDVSPYLDKGVFQQLRDPECFTAVEVVAGSLEWPHEIDLSYDTVYLEGRVVGADVQEVA